jgi:voltage-gated potassium channel
LHEIIFEADTREGRLFDLLLLVAIVTSVLVVGLESVATVRARVGTTLRALEWVVTALFSVEYILRLAAVREPLRYARSPFGIIDLVAILPTYLSVVLPGAQSLLVVRLLRLLRIFRVLKLAEYLRESRVLAQAMRASGRKIAVFRPRTGDGAPRPISVITITPSTKLPATLVVNVATGNSSGPFGIRRAIA